MYERLDKLRDELKKAEKRKEDADKKLKIAQDRLREAESTQILADVEALHLTPEQVGQFLSMAANGQLPGMGNVPRDGNLMYNDSAEEAEKYDPYSDVSRGTEDEQTEEREDEYNA